MADIALVAGVSPMTVSRVINRRPGVSQAVRDHVQSVISTLGYAPNEAARALAGNLPPRIAMLYRNPHASSFPEIVKSSVEAAGRGLIHLLIRECPTKEEVAATVKQLQCHVEGFILCPPLGEIAQVRSALLDARALTAVLATPLEDPSMTTIGINDFAAAAEMTRHLISLGHRRIGFITGHAGQLASARRLAGYQSALECAGLGGEDRLIASGLFSYRSGLDAAEQLLGLVDRPTAIFASSDEMAAACVTVAAARGLSVPADLSICGFDDTALATIISPGLTTVRQPLAAMAGLAVNRLVDLIQTRREDRLVRHARHQLGYEIIRRQSDAAPRRLPREASAATA